MIIPAAGSGSRFGGDIPKQFRMLGGKPILQRVVERFLLHERVGRIVVAVAEILLAEVKQTDRVRFVAGGATRQQSVANALAARASTSRRMVVRKHCGVCAAKSNCRSGVWTMVSSRTR